MKKKKLYICSCGMRTGQITPETIKALKLSEVVFSHSLGGPGAAVIRGLCRDFRPLADKQPAEIVRAVKAAFRTCRTAAFLTYGNPFFLNAAADLLRSELAKNGVNVESLPAVSSFDSMIDMPGLGEFPAAGVRLIHAGLSGGEITFYPDMATLVFMMDKLNRAEKREHAGVKEKFISKIAAVYPPGHEVLIVNAPFMEDRSGRVIRTRVKDLARDFGKADRNSTLYIPAVKTAL